MTALTAGRSVIWGTDTPGDDREEADAGSLYRFLEAEVVPRFYEHGPDGLPGSWLSARRMVKGDVEPVSFSVVSPDRDSTRRERR